ncbi:olfactory receptor 7G3-like [Fukomys damarensis]|uniref:olfactory receptor 7G3-like n=1 Tax=Fukomys damarensis TaxID=885580 RepID=UPI0008FEE305|nr:olfactory receptor 7G3-like [Fukomys damarensis]
MPVPQPKPRPPESLKLVAQPFVLHKVPQRIQDLWLKPVIPKWAESLQSRACLFPNTWKVVEASDRDRNHKGKVCFVLVFAGLENFLLAAMAYNRFIAICNPLRYKVIMNSCLCVLLTLFSLLISTVDALLHCLMVLHLSFCADLEIPHFFCELDQVIKLACSDTLLNNILVYVVTSILGGIPLLGIIFSYFKITSSILRMPSTEGKYKAFSTCGSHLSVVSLFYGTAFGVYNSSAVTDSSRKTAVASVMYTVVPPMLNPFIYSLRSRDIKKALKKLIRTSHFLKLCHLL